MNFRETFDKSLVEHLGNRCYEAEAIWRHIYGFTGGKPVGDLLENFTDHGRRHISDVVQTCWKLIPEKLKSRLPENDIFYLFTSALYHDIAMHLDINRLRCIIQTNNCYESHATSFGDKPWKREWAGFGISLLTYNNEQLKSVFGRDDLSESDLLSSVNLETMTEYTKSAAGEFVRMHHARLAFEFAYYGLPDVNGILKPLAEKRTEAELIGEIARSHGYPIRKMIKHLRSSGDGLMPSLSSHVVYLMAILRISDYIQIGPERANKTILLYKSLNNPVSDLEWQINDAVDGVTEDRSKLIFTINPLKVLSVKHYFRIKAFFDELTNELDLAVASLYDEDTEIFSLGHPFLYRKIESDIDHDRCKRQLAFLPIDSRIKIAAEDLIKLLVGPLYGFDKSVALREMLQNSMDAIEIRKSLDLNKLSYYSQRHDIEVIADTANQLLTVRDSGTGMDKDVILSKFLTIGATTKIRPKSSSIEEDLPLRGRFGVGALAMFLVADSVIVRTRKVGSNEPGYEIMIDKDHLDATEIREIQNSPFGTEIVLALRKSVSKYEFSHNWILSRDFDISIVVDGKQEQRSGYYPGQHWHITYPFREFKLGNITCHYRGRTGMGNVSVNGIDVQLYYPSRGSVNVDFNLWDVASEVSINLQRNTLVDLDRWLNLIAAEESLNLKALASLLNVENEAHMCKLLEQCQRCFPGAAVSVERSQESCVITIWTFIHYNYINWGNKGRNVLLIEGRDGNCFLCPQARDGAPLGEGAQVYFMDRLDGDLHQYREQIGTIRWCKHLNKEEWEQVKKALPSVKILRSPKIISTLVVSPNRDKSKSKRASEDIDSRHIMYWKEALPLFKLK